VTDSAKSPAQEMLDSAYRALSDAYEKGQRSRDAEVERLTRELAELRGVRATRLCYYCSAIEPGWRDGQCLKCGEPSK